MNADFTLTVGSILLAILLFAVLYVLGVGVLPILAELRDLVAQKKIEVFRRAQALEKQIANSSNIATTLVHDVANSVTIEATDSWVITTASVLTEGLKTLQQVLPIKDAEVTPEEFERGAEQVVEFIKKLTDNVEGNLPTIPG